MKKVAIIGTVGVPANYGGYETLVENLLDKRVSSEIEYHIYCSSKAYSEKRKQYKGATLSYLPLNANGWQAIPYDILSFLHAYFHSDVVLACGGICTYVLPVLRLFSKKKKILVNFDGLETKREKWGIIPKIIIGGARYCASKFANIHVADNDEIRKIINGLYGINAVLIEYGGDNAEVIFDAERLKSQYSLKQGAYCFKVARIEPENNIHLVLEAFKYLPNEQLVLVGNWNKSNYGRNLRKEYQNDKNIRMLDPIYEAKEINLLRSGCKLYIHGHSAGGTNPSLVEAMNLALPIIAYGVNYNISTTENQAIYFRSSEELLKIIRSVTSERLKGVAEKMKEIADRRYKWNIICKKYEDLFLN